jgi:uncharacterized membrane protein
MISCGFFALKTEQKSKVDQLTSLGRVSNGNPNIGLEAIFSPAILKGKVQEAGLRADTNLFNTLPGVVFATIGI